METNPTDHGSQKQADSNTGRIVHLEQGPVEAVIGTQRIVMAAMAIVLVCVAIVCVFLVLNETSTQRNADRDSEQNEALQAELRCRAEPSLQYDVEFSKLQIAIGQGLQAVIADDRTALLAAGDTIGEQTPRVQEALQARRDSLTTCAVTNP